MRNEAFWIWFDDVARPQLGPRAPTFAAMFEHLDSFDRPVTIIETGCSRHPLDHPDAWKGDGASTVQFDRYVRARADGSTLYSVDLDAEACEAAHRNICEANGSFDHSVTYISVGDSVVYLRHAAARWIKTGEPAPDLVYLDSHDYNPADPIPSAVHHHAELLAAMPMIWDGTLVVVDDSPASIDDVPRAEVGGKGFLVARHMLLCGAEMKFCRYQVGWTRVRSVKSKAEVDLKELVERARSLVEADQVVAAEQLYRLVLGLTTPPESGMARIAHGEACMFYGRMALGKQKLGVAADWLREALQADPLASDYRLDLVQNCYMPMGAMKQALTEAERAAKIDPAYPRVWHVLGGLHHEMGDAAKCVEAYDRQIELSPGDTDAMLDRCVIALDLADYATAEALCAEVMGTDREADAWHCMAMIAYRQHEHERAVDLFDKAIAMGCRDKATAEWNKSLALHSIGRYAEGWPAHERREDARSNAQLYLPMKRFTRPRWDGVEPALKGDGTPKLIHVHAEAGAGDNLALVRYLPLLEERGFRVRYEAMDGMGELIAHSFPSVEIVPRALDYPGALGIRDFDCHIPVGSLPAAFGTLVETIPWRGPYLRAPIGTVPRFAFMEKTPKVGLCWSSGIRKTGIWIEEYGRRKSMHFETMIPVVEDLQRNDIQTINLQVGPEREQHGGWLKDPLGAKPTWAETAALVDNLDLVITVDTGLAHLAGAMGKETWLLCQRDGCSWHFMCWRPGAPWNEASPWYPTMRVFRQATFDQPHAWSDVIENVVSELASWAALKRAKAAG